MDVPISLAILLAAGMSLFETLQGGHHAYFDAALSLTFFLLIGRYMDHQTRSAARSAAKELTALEVQTAERISDLGVETVAVSKLRCGDSVLVASGSRVPVDGILLSARALMDRALLTGESTPASAKSGDMMQAGEINLGAPLEMRATKVGEDTSLRRMAALIETAENARNSYTALADRAAAIYAPAVHLLALAAFIVWASLTGDLRLATNIAIAVLIITCPCALGLAVPAVSTAAISRLFGEGFLVKHATALERLAEVDHIVFDKTGTLTRPSITFSEHPDELTKSLAKGLAQASQHPLSKALMDALPNVKPVALRNITEEPGNGIQANYKGAHVRLGRGSWLGGSFPGLGLKIGDQTPIEIRVEETIREGVPEALGRLNIPAEILTGDTEGPANQVAETLGLPVTAKVLPGDKLDRLKGLSEEGHHVLMVGDGLNDTAALAAAHASIAPSSALEASRNAADVVALKESFHALPLVIAVAKASRSISQQNFAIAALYNCIAVPIALAGFATPLAAALAMSLSSITVLLNAQRMRFVQ